ncbi:hypothetical protein C0995_011394, partial [Termitomyces sp. Mi166
MQKKHPPLAALVIAKHVKLVQAAKAFLKWQGKSSQFFILEGYKGKAKAKALLSDSEQTGAKQTFKLTELVDSNSDKEEEEEREIIELEDEEVEIVATPAAGPSQQPSKPVVLVPSTLKPIPKPIVALLSPVAGPSTAPIVPSSASKPAATMPLFKPVPVKSAGPAIKGDTEESGALIINQAIEVAVTQETLQDKESSNEDNDKDGNDNEDGKGDDDNSDDDNATMDVDSAKHTEKTRPMALAKATVTEVKAPAPVP